MRRSLKKNPDRDFNAFIAALGKSRRYPPEMYGSLDRPADRCTTVGAKSSLGPTPARDPADDSADPMDEAGGVGDPAEAFAFRAPLMQRATFRWCSPFVRHGASTTTLERRATFRNRKGRSAIRRLARLATLPRVTVICASRTTP